MDEGPYDYVLDALAYDAANDLLYYAERAEAGGTLYVHDLAAGGTEVAGTLSGTARGAVFHDGGYYYVPDLTSTLYRVELAADGTVESEVEVTEFAPEEDLEVVDLAVRDGVLYGSTSAMNGGVAQFFSYDLAAGTFTKLQEYAGGAFQQLAFGGDGILYGALTGTPGNDDQQFFVIDPATGETTDPGYWPEIHFADLASGEACATAPATEEPAEDPAADDADGRTESAWAGSKPFPRARNWSRYFVYVIEAPVADPEAEGDGHDGWDEEHDHEDHDEHRDGDEHDDDRNEGGHHDDDDDHDDGDDDDDDGDDEDGDDDHDEEDDD